jgi:hypothetical protein
MTRLCRHITHASGQDELASKWCVEVCLQSEHAKVDPCEKIVVAVVRCICTALTVWASRPMAGTVPGNFSAKPVASVPKLLTAPREMTPCG